MKIKNIVSNPSEAIKRFENGCWMRRNPQEVST